mmetsp:Transcript_22478/g.52498  ORF Transcript_22478/g.52498 Transcript_22478/m.52498 type:complete len:272 (+) Transcript_22478:382-1197(+)
MADLVDLLPQKTLRGMRCERQGEIRKQHLVGLYQEAGVVVSIFVDKFLRLQAVVEADVGKFETHVSINWDQLDSRFVGAKRLDELRIATHEVRIEQHASRQHHDQVGDSWETLAHLLGTPDDLNFLLKCPLHQGLKDLASRQGLQVDKVAQNQDLGCACALGYVGKGSSRDLAGVDELDDCALLFWDWGQPDELQHGQFHEVPVGVADHLLGDAVAGDQVFLLVRPRVTHPLDVIGSEDCETVGLKHNDRHIVGMRRDDFTCAPNTLQHLW